MTLGFGSGEEGTGLHIGCPIIFIAVHSVEESTPFYTPIAPFIFGAVVFILVHGSRDST
jgi:hypothetical protein